MKLKIPNYVISTARILIKEGYKAYLVGGAVRDAFLGLTPADYDIATDALPDQLITLFPKAIGVGAKFGTVVVVQRDVNGENFSTEVTTLRSEEEYIRGRWPTRVEFVRDIVKDLERRDFTINAMAIDLGSKGLSYLNEAMASDSVVLTTENEFDFDIIDPFDGKKDIASKIIRTVGNPMDRFTEDGIRTYKACRLAAQLGFTIEPGTFEAINKCLTVAKMISMERVRDEFMKLLMKSPKPSVGIELMRKSGLLEIFMPELIKGVGVEQPIGHDFDVYEHSLRALDLAPDKIRVAALLHDIAKPQTATGDGHFYGHDQLGAEMTKKIMKRMRFSTKEIEKTSELVRWHMFAYPVETADTKKQEGTFEFKGWTDSAVRRFIKRVGVENLDDLFSLRIADGTSEPGGMWNPEEINQLQARISKILLEDTALKVSDLALDGTHIMKHFGIKPGKLIGDILAYLLDQVLENPNLNNKEELLKLTEEFIKKNQ